MSEYDVMKDRINRHLAALSTKAKGQKEPLTAWDIPLELAGLLGCYHSGHPNRPAAKRKYSHNPWRCERCGVWFIAEYTLGGYDGAWLWKPIKEGR